MDLIDLGKLVLILQDQISSFEQLLLHHPDPEQLEMIDNQLKTANNTLDLYEKLSKNYFNRVRKTIKNVEDTVSSLQNEPINCWIPIEDNIVINYSGNPQLLNPMIFSGIQDPRQRVSTVFKPLLEVISYDEEVSESSAKPVRDPRLKKLFTDNEECCDIPKPLEIKKEEEEYKPKKIVQRSTSFIETGLPVSSKVPKKNRRKSIHTVPSHKSHPAPMEYVCVSSFGLKTILKPVIRSQRSKSFTETPTLEKINCRRKTIHSSKAEKNPKKKKIRELKWLEKPRTRSSTKIYKNFNIKDCFILLKRCDVNKVSRK